MAMLTAETWPRALIIVHLPVSVLAVHAGLAVRTAAVAGGGGEGTIKQHRTDRLLLL